MNLTILPVNVMLAQSRHWLTTPDLVKDISAHPVGAALLAEVGKAHDWLAEQSQRRRQLEVTLARLSELIVQRDSVHDSMARAIHAVLEALIQVTQDAALAATYVRLQKLLFPEGLSIVTRSYVYEAGAIEALKRRVTPEVLAQLAAIPVGTATLADWYHAWVEAGQALGEHVQERMHLLKRTSRGGTGAAQVSTHEMRSKWISTVRAFLNTLDLMNLSPETRERILSPLEASIESALRGRGGNGNEGEDETASPVDEDAGTPGDISVPLSDQPEPGKPIHDIAPPIHGQDPGR